MKHPLNTRAGRVAAQAMATMMRAVEAFQEAILMVDASAEPWRVLYVNSAFLDRVGALGSRSFETLYYSLVCRVMLQEIIC